jgi:hypothetical protein
VPSTADLATVPGLPESRLAATDLDRLPATSPSAPWTCRTRAILWIQTGRPPVHPWLGRATRLTAVAFVHYLDSPVGEYHEILAGTVLRGVPPLVQVPFIAVDSLASVHGGRANWALPKTMARFDGDFAAGGAQVEAPGWSARVEVVRSGPRLPLRLGLNSVGPLGRYHSTMRVTGRPSLLRTRIEGPTIGAWLGSGRHLGLLLEGRMAIDPPVQR